MTSWVFCCKEQNWLMVPSCCSSGAIPKFTVRSHFLQTAPSQWLSTVQLSISTVQLLVNKASLIDDYDSRIPYQADQTFLRIVLQSDTLSTQLFFFLNLLQKCQNCIILWRLSSSSALSPLQWNELCPFIIFELNVTVSRDGTYKEVIKFKWGHKSGAMIWRDKCSHKEKHQKAHSPSPLCEDTARK